MILGVSLIQQIRFLVADAAKQGRLLSVIPDVKANTFHAIAGMSDHNVDGIVTVGVVVRGVMSVPLRHFQDPCSLDAREYFHRVLTEHAQEAADNEAEKLQENIDGKG